jgi:hypothetical protein
MATLEYQERERRLLPRGLTRWIARLFIAAVILAAGVVAVGVFAEQQAISQFNEKTSDAKLRGKTADQIIAILGKPDDDADYGKGSRWLVYRGPWGSMCGIMVGPGEPGVANDVTHWGK